MSCLSSGCLWYPRPVLHHPWLNKGGMWSHLCGKHNSHLLVNNNFFYIHFNFQTIYNLIAIPATMFLWWSALPAEWGLRWLEPLLQVVFLSFIFFVARGFVVFFLLFFCCRWFFYLLFFCCCRWFCCFFYLFLLQVFFLSLIFFCYWWFDLSLVLYDGSC